MVRYIAIVSSSHLTTSFQEAFDNVDEPYHVLLVSMRLMVKYMILTWCLHEKACGKVQGHCLKLTSYHKLTKKLVVIKA